MQLFKVWILMGLWMQIENLSYGVLVVEDINGLVV